MNQVNEESTATDKELDQIVEVRSEQLLACSQDILTIGSEGLVEYYRTRNYSALPTLAMEDASQQSLVNRIGEKISAFFRWVRDLTERMIEKVTTIITGRDKLSGEVKEASKIKALNKPLELEKIPRDDQYSGSYHSLAAARNTFSSRKQIVIDQCTELAKASPVHAAFFYDREAEATDVIDAYVGGLEKIIPLVGASMTALKASKDLVSGREIMESTWTKYQDLSTQVFQDPDPSTGGKTLLVKLSERMHGGEVSSRDLMIKMAQVAEAGDDCREGIAKALKGLQAIIEDFPENEILKRAGELADPAESREFIRSVGNISKMLVQSLTMVRQFDGFMSVPADFTVKVRSLIASYHHVQAAIKQAETNENLDAEAGKLLAELKKDFA